MPIEVKALRITLGPRGGEPLIGVEGREARPAGAIEHPSRACPTCRGVARADFGKVFGNHDGLILNACIECEEPRLGDRGDLRGVL